MENIIEINGVKYAPIKKLTRAVPKKLGEILAIPFTIYGNYMHMLDEFSSYSRKLPKGLDIIKEYELIQLKKSELSKWERDTVTHIFLKNFYKYEQ